MSLIPTPPALKEALACAFKAEQLARSADTSAAWMAAADAWKAVTKLARGS